MRGTRVLAKLAFDLASEVCTVFPLLAVASAVLHAVSVCVHAGGGIGLSVEILARTSPRIANGKIIEATEPTASSLSLDSDGLLVTQSLCY